MRFTANPQSHQVTVQRGSRAPQLRTLPAVFFDPQHAGIWWEAVVARAVAGSGVARESYWQYAWGWPTNEHPGFMTELDVIASAGPHQLAISCKAGRVRDLKKWATELRAEATLRLGRFTLCFLADPYGASHESSDDLVATNKVAILTPADLQHAGAFRQAIERLANRLRTTVTPHLREGNR